MANVSLTSALEQLPAPHQLFDGDLPPSVATQLSRAPRIAGDIETGLNWSTDTIALCQLYADGLPVTMVRVTHTPPPRLRSLLENSAVQKVFHHAMFDLRFMAHCWSAHPQNVACTKIASKLLFPDKPDEQKLQRLLDRFLGVGINKAEQLSNWFAPSYSAAQLAYAAADVIHLGELLDKLLRELDRRSLRTLAERCYAHIPTRVQLEIGAFGDVFIY